MQLILNPNSITHRLLGDAPHMMDYDIVSVRDTHERDCRECCRTGEILLCSITGVIRESVERLGWEARTLCENYGVLCDT